MFWRFAVEWTPLAKETGRDVASEREKILQAAQKFVDKKRYDKAIEEYQKIVQQDANDARTLLKIGDLQARIEAYPEAIATYDRVGQYYASQGFALKAIAVYKQIRELIRKHAPNLAERYAHIVPKLAEIYTQLGLTSDALSAYDEVATRFQRAGQDREAIEVFRKMVALDATNPLPHLRLAEACCRVQELDPAVESFWAAAELLLKLGRRDDALKVVERILHFRQDPRYARSAAELYLERGTREDGLQALSKLQICFQADPRNLETLGLLAQTFTLIGQESKSLEVYKEMARVAREAGKTELYAQLLEHLGAIAPDDEGVRSMRAGQQPAPRPASIAPESSAHVVDDEVEIIDDEPAPAWQAPQVTSPARYLQASSPDVVVVADGVEAVEELQGPGSFDSRAHARQAVLDCEAYRKLKLYSKAVEVLSVALEIDPRSVEIREKLREVLAEAGDHDGAIGESITLAAIYLEQGDAERAEMLLYDVLDREPDHPVALEMLQQIGGGIVPGAGYAPASSQSLAGLDEPYDPNEPLPSYDLEEVRPSRAFASQHPPPVSLADDPFSSTQIDDPFGVEAPLPSFPLGFDHGDDLMAGLDPQAGYDAAAAYGSPTGYDAEPAAPELDGFDDEAVTFDEPDVIEPLPAFDAPDGLDFDEPESAAAPSPPSSISSESMEAIEEALEEAEFFTSRGLYDDAKTILVDQLSRTPNHPLIVERLREIEAAAADAGASRTIERSQLGAEPAPAEADHAFDIAASLDALDGIEVGSLEPEAAGFANVNQEVDVDQVFAKFKEGVRAQVSETDTATHYDLGVAYKEMGLLTDAIGEFELAGRDPARECMCFAMIGMIHLERGELERAADAYKRGLAADQKTIDQEMSLYYDLGVVYEMKESRDEALYYFRKIARRDPGFRDVKDRIAALEPQGAPAPAPSRAVGDDDEFDRAFDDLFDTK